MKARTLLKVAGVALGAVVASHLLLYRVVFGVSRPDPHLISDEAWLPLALSAALVVIAVGLACRLCSSRWAALAGAVVAAVTVQLYFVCIDFLEVGWGGLVGHDLWWGDEQYWFIALVRLALIGAVFVITALGSWGAWRNGRFDAAG